MLELRNVYSSVSTDVAIACLCYAVFVLVSEMVAVNALSRKNAKTYRIADVRDEKYPVTVQLVGSDASLFADAAQLASEVGASGIDINMGCPVRKIVASGSGSALMKDINKAAAIIKTVVNAVKLPVSVKFRKGWDNESVNAVDFAKMCEDSGASFVTVHGRTRAQGYSGTADWQIIGEVKKVIVGKDEAIIKLITSVLSKGHILLEDIPGVGKIMVGRAALGAPWLLGQIARYLKEGNYDNNISIDEVKQTLLEHIELLRGYYGEQLALALSRKYVCWYSKNLYDAKRFRENYMKITDYKTALEEIDRYFDLSKERDTCE